MGDAADDMYEREMYAVENTKFCPVHELWYVDYDYGCPACEDPNYPLPGKDNIS